MQTRFCVRRGHSAAVYTSGRRSTSLAQNSIPTFVHIGEKRLGGHHLSEETRDSTPSEEGEIPQTQTEEEEGDVVEIVTTTGIRDVVEEECHFTSESAQILIGEIMGCNRDLENIKQNINDVQNKMKNIIDVLGRI
ncbi:hypothetical protein AB205_0183900 [Aquarana catesbeiana]|uniref:Uncharacterized protein n=1 Tax=Aquarana catesbeiana TaxID=8400 RepID=A0A2G9QC92_AQUCT|nr:hypothetical protein AB205_0183900 [Aquarana catesbeiana]